jgi:hypothetical protein
MRLGIGGDLRVLLLVLGGVAVACSGRVAGTGNNGGTSSSGSSSGASSSGVTTSSSDGGSSSGASSSGVSSSTGGSDSGGGCSSSPNGCGGSSGSDLCAQLPSSACIEPPTPPSGPATSLTTPHNYAVQKLYLGDTDRTGITSTNAWQSFGYDLDGKVTSAASTDVCTLVPGASKSVQIDGEGGIDNSWGENIMPILQTLDSTFSQTENNAIQSGAPTQLFYVVGFDDSAGNMTTATGLTGVALTGAQYSANGGTVPTWDLNTHWPIAPQSLSCYPSGGTDGCTASTDPIAAADVKFPAAFQTGGTFVNGTPADITLSLPMGGQALVVNLHDAVVTFYPQVPGSVTNGTIAGVLNTQELIAALQQVAGQISTSLCSGSAFMSIASQIQQTSDMVLNGDTVTNTAGVTCNAISIGLGFDATEIALPTSADIAPQQPPPVDPCGG